MTAHKVAKGEQWTQKATIGGKSYEFTWQGGNVIGFCLADATLPPNLHSRKIGDAVRKAVRQGR